MKTNKSEVTIVFWWLKLPEESKISFEFNPCSITQLKVNEWEERTIAKLNDTAHLVSHDREFPLDEKVLNP